MKEKTGYYDGITNIQCEIDKEYFMKAKKRIETYLSQGDLFSVKQQVKFIEP